MGREALKGKETPKTKKEKRERGLQDNQTTKFFFVTEFDRSVYCGSERKKKPAREREPRKRRDQKKKRREERRDLRTNFFLLRFELVSGVVRMEVARDEWEKIKL